MLKAIIELIGPPGGGKSILAELTAKALAPHSVLLIDASVDQRLTKHLTPPLSGQAAPQTQTLTTLIQQFIDNESKYGLCGSHQQEAQQAIDWAFHDLPTTVSFGSTHDVDLITVGLLTEQLPDKILSIVRYGLTRLFDTHDFVVIDGYHKILHGCLDPELLNLITVCHPNETAPLPEKLNWHGTPNLILSQFGSHELSETLSAAIEAQDLRLIGKIPAFDSNDSMHAELPSLFDDCLMRLDLPVFNRLRQ